MIQNYKNYSQITVFNKRDGKTTGKKQQFIRGKASRADNKLIRINI